MNTSYRSFAKINLHLRVLSRRRDGYHELETVFQSIGLADRISLELTAGEIDLSVRSGSAPEGEENLAYQAAAGFLRRWSPDSGVRIGLDKVIPLGGGLGGGSSNAATVLSGLRDLLGVPENPEAMLDLARQLGADVPYFLMGGTALGSGRGDDLIRLPDLPQREVWLVTPPVEISTARIFGELDLSDLNEVRPEQVGTWSERCDWEAMTRGWNDLESTVMSCYPVVRDVYNGLVEGGATWVRLSGTGATVFAFFASPPDTSGLTGKLPFGSRVVQTETLGRSALDKLRVVR